MTRLGWTLVAAGFLLQLLIPLNAIDLRGLSGWTPLAIPGPLMGILLASVAMVIGVLLVYLFWYKDRAVHMDRLDHLDRGDRSR